MANKKKKNRSEKIVADEKSYTVAEEEGGQENGEKACGRQGVQTCLEEKDHQENWQKTCEEDRP